MLLVEITIERITDILKSARPIALIPTENRDRLKEIEIAARDAGFGVAVIQNRAECLLVLVVGDAGRIEELRRFVGRYGAEIATDRNVNLEKVYVPASWLTGMAKSQGADGGSNFLVDVQLATERCNGRLFKTRCSF